MASQGPPGMSQPVGMSQVMTPGPQGGQMGSGQQQPLPGMPLSGPPNPTTAAAPPQPQIDFDPISKVKVLVPHLKESLSNLMKIASQGFQSSTSIDNPSQTGKVGDIPPQRVDKSLEEFYSICDQVELYLRLGLDCSTQYVDGIRHSPPTLSTVKSDLGPTGDNQTYNQYVATVKSQIAYAKDVHDALVDCSGKLREDKT